MAGGEHRMAGVRCVLHLEYLGNGTMKKDSVHLCECWNWELAVCGREHRHRLVCDH